jgi:hypothetical protein
MMWLAGGSALSTVIGRSDDPVMPAEGMSVASERAEGESRRIGLKRKAAEITRSAAEDFALLTARTTSARLAADFLSIVANVNNHFQGFSLAQSFLYLMNLFFFSPLTSQLMFHIEPYTVSQSKKCLKCCQMQKHTRFSLQVTYADLRCI